MNTLPAIFSFNHVLRFALVTMLAICSSMTLAKDISPKDAVSIENAWVRPTVSGQDVGAAYMSFSSRQDVTLVHAESDVTKSVEIHSMSMQNGVMKMRMLDTLAIKAGKPYKLEPGGFHLMLFDLKKPLNSGDYVNFEFTFKSGNTEFKQKIKAPIKTPADSDEDHSHHHHH